VAEVGIGEDTKQLIQMVRQPEVIVGRICHVLGIGSSDGSVPVELSRPGRLVIPHKADPSIMSREFSDDLRGEGGAPSPITRSSKSSTDCLKTAGMERRRIGP
jgi:hypothetical protein